MWKKQRINEWRASKLLNKSMSFNAPNERHHQKHRFNAARDRPFGLHERWFVANVYSDSLLFLDFFFPLFYFSLFSPSPPPAREWCAYLDLVVVTARHKEWLRRVEVNPPDWAVMLVKLVNNRPHPVIGKLQHTTVK